MADVQITSSFLEIFKDYEFYNAEWKYSSSTPGYVYV
jgi:hypothetical protein